MTDSKKNKTTTKTTKILSNTNIKSTEAVKADKAKIKKETKPATKAKKTVSASNKTKSSTKSTAAKTKATAKPKPKTRASKAKAPAKNKSSNKRSLNNVFINQDNNVHDLNTSAGYPLHPNRIWPD